jgi:magnesium transporter
MDIFHIDDCKVILNGEAQATHQIAEGFLWVDSTHDEVIADPEKWRARIEKITGIQLYDFHLIDVVNLSHPSYFDSTQEYELVVFRKLMLHNGATAAGTNTANTANATSASALNKLVTIPVSFLLMGCCLVTVRSCNSRTIEQARTRLLNYKPKSDVTTHTSRLPASPEDLMLRLLNSMVDQYLELRLPLTLQLDRWQHALLDPRRPFNNWLALLDSRLELRKLDNLCEEQHDALQELRDHIIDTHDVNDEASSRSKDLLLVRANDVIEHITRVLNHARRLEATLESAVQIHFAAMAHRTSEIMRTLTVITALFMPLTLITGIFGMNFIEMPLLKDALGFWFTMGMMLVVVIVLLLYFRRKRYIEDRGTAASD